MRKVECSNSGRDTPKSLKHVDSVPMSNAWQQAWVSQVIRDYPINRCSVQHKVWRAWNLHFSMAMSFQHRSKFPPFHQQWCRLQWVDNSPEGRRTTRPPTSCISVFLYFLFINHNISLYISALLANLFLCAYIYISSELNTPHLCISKVQVNQLRSFFADLTF